MCAYICTYTRTCVCVCVLYMCLCMCVCAYTCIHTRFTTLQVASTSTPQKKDFLRRKHMHTHKRTYNKDTTHGLIVLAYNTMYTHNRCKTVHIIHIYVCKSGYMFMYRSMCLEVQDQYDAYTQSKF